MDYRRCFRAYILWNTSFSSWPSSLHHPPRTWISGSYISLQDAGKSLEKNLPHTFDLKGTFKPSESDFDLLCPFSSEIRKWMLMNNVYFNVKFFICKWKLILSCLKSFLKFSNLCNYGKYFIMRSHWVIAETKAKKLLSLLLVMLMNNMYLYPFEAMLLSLSVNTAQVRYNNCTTV